MAHIKITVTNNDDGHTYSSDYWEMDEFGKGHEAHVLALLQIPTVNVVELQAIGNTTWKYELVEEGDA